MSASPHSLSFSPRRNSLGSQLPLPTSLNASMSQRPPVGVTVSTIARPNSPTLHTRGLSTASASSRPNPPASPTSTYFPSSTHVGGIHPSASFFRPSRPNYQPDFSRPRPDSISSFHAIPELPAESDQEPDAFPLSPLAKHHHDSDDGHQILESLNGHGDSSVEQHDPQQQQQHEQFLSLKRMKQSREPLLPIGARPGGLTRPSIARERSGSSGGPLSPSSRSRIVRNSFDKVLSLSRGLSFDSIRRSTGSIRASPGTSEVGGRPTFESKLSDEERPNGNGNSHSPPLRSASPVHFTKNPTLSISHSRRSSASSASSRSSSQSPPSPFPPSSFNPIPPAHTPPLSHTPRIDPATGKVMRRYQFHPSRNRFYLRGRLMTGGDSPYAFLACFGLLLGVSGVWFSTTCVWWWRNVSPAVVVVGAYLAGLTISSMLATASQDPGIIPRNLDPDPPYPATSPSDGGIRAPMPRDLKVRTDVVRVKYCPTCKTYRPPRSSHCKMCDNCVDGCDHHCQWVNNCVGRRNYSTFFVLLLSATTTLILIILTTALHLYFLTRRQGLSFRGALSQRAGIGSAVAFCLSIAVIWPVGALLSYHLRLLFLNVTTIEQIRNQAHKSLVPGPPPPNPFSHGSWRRNLMAVLCRPQGYSWLDAAGVATEDRREVNPGLVDAAGVWDGSTPNSATRGR